MSGLRERVQKLRDEWADPAGRGPTLTKRDCAAELTRILDADPAASTADAPSMAPPRDPAAAARIAASKTKHPLKLGPDAPADTTLRDQIAAMLAEHRLHASMNICLGCDWRPEKYAGSLADQHEAHRADALLPLLRAHDAQVAAQARRDALNEAADEVARAWGPQDSNDVAAWLRVLAEQNTPDQARSEPTERQ